MVAKPFDLTKYGKTVSKTLKVQPGFFNPETWIDTGCYALNYRISGSFFKGVPLDGKVTVFAGESGCLPSSGRLTLLVNGQERASTVGELRSLWQSNIRDLLLATPDGWQKVVNWFDKGVLEMVALLTQNGHHTRCAVNHMIETIVNGTQTWVPATDLDIGDVVLTVDGPSPVVSLAAVGTEECYDFEVDHENHRYWGDGMSSHNSGKSYIVSGNMIRWATENDIMVVLFDSENAIDRSWIEALKVEIDSEKILRVPVGSPDEVALAISMFMDNYEALYEEVPYEERQKVLFVIDSIGMLSTTSEKEQFQRGEMKGDKGIKAKSLKALVTQALRVFSGHPLGMVATAHSYKSQDMYNPDDVIGGGVGFIYASSIVVGMNKLKLKEDDDGNKISEVRGVRAKVKVVKSRYSKPFEEVEIRIPYDTGMNPYSGLFEMFEKMGLLTKSGTRYEWLDEHGEIHKYYRREWTQNTELLTRMMKFVEARDAGKKTDGFDETHAIDFL